MRNILRVAPAHRRSISLLETRAAPLITVDSPNVARVVGFGTGDGYAYLVSEHVEGFSMERALRLRGVFSSGEMAEIFSGVCRGLTALHRVGFICGIINPRDLLLVSDEGGGPGVKITGIDRSFFDRHLQVSRPRVVGTISYTTPELYAGGEATPAADVFSLSDIGYEMLTGERPILGRTPFGYGPVLYGRELPSIRPFNQSVDPRLEASVMRALDPDPGKRFASPRSSRGRLCKYLPGSAGVNSIV
jgi:eukaryotic-like serine/threonine-protein kinase